MFQLTWQVYYLSVVYWCLNCWLVQSEWLLTSLHLVVGVEFPADEGDSGALKLTVLVKVCRVTFQRRFYCHIRWLRCFHTHCPGKDLQSALSTKIWLCRIGSEYSAGDMKFYSPSEEKVCDLHATRRCFLPFVYRFMIPLSCCFPNPLVSIACSSFFHS